MDPQTAAIKQQNVPKKKKKIIPRNLDQLSNWLNYNQSSETLKYFNESWN